jgi:AcrR family transcriptional regulator
MDALGMELVALRARLYLSSRSHNRYSSGMSIPVSEPWATLDAESKRERLLRAAGRAFARDGLDASMPSVAAEAGAGVASIYRQFPSKYDLLAALVIRRLDEVAEAAQRATEREGERWIALTEMLWTLVEQKSGDDFLGEARVMVADHPGVQAATDRTWAALEELLAGARAEGRLRADATPEDLRLVFAATRAAKQIEPGAWQRMLSLLIDALEAH